ncbi:MAG TPA: hypothetical protein VIU61_10125, partial [Kofleriaceae bacterium]
MERRALLAAVLCLVVLVAYQEALRYFYPMPAEEAGPAQTAVPLEQPSPAPAADLTTPPDVGAAPAVAAEPVVVETDVF